MDLPRWLGFLLMNVGETGNFISYAFAPASVVAPLGTVIDFCLQLPTRSHTSSVCSDRQLPFRPFAPPRTATQGETPTFFSDIDLTAPLY